MSNLAAIIEAADPQALVIVDESSPRCNVATDIVAQVAQDGFKFLKAPARMVSPPHVPVPFSSALEDIYIPNASTVTEAIAEIMPDKVIV